MGDLEKVSLKFICPPAGLPSLPPLPPALQAALSTCMRTHQPGYLEPLQTAALDPSLALEGHILGGMVYPQKDRPVDEALVGSPSRLGLFRWIIPDS